MTHRHFMPLVLAGFVLIQPLAADAAPAFQIVPGAAEDHTVAGDGLIAMPWIQDMADRVTRLDDMLATLEARSLTHADLPMVGAGPSLRPGDSGPRVEALRGRLSALGYDSMPHAIFDESLETAVKAYQSDQGLVADGIVGRATQARLDIGDEQALAAIRATADRMRAFLAEEWSTTDLVLINAADQRLWRIQDGTMAYDMKVAVGRPSRRTPLLRDRITHVVLNPTWTVPPGIMSKDKLPQLRKGALQVANASVFLDGELVEDTSAVDWSSVTPGRVRIVQAPGAANALGVVKFQLTNADNIYLHDTDSPRVFDKDARAVSSGCVRLSDPMSLAQDLLAAEGWEAERIDDAIRRGHTQWLALSEPLAVRIVYWTADVTPDGTLKVAPDIYGMDHRPI